MVWVMVAVILGSLIYLVAVIGGYVSFLGEAKPRNKQARERAQKLEEAANKERTLYKVVQGQIEDEKTGISNLKLDMVSAEKELQEAKQTQEEIEMGKYKEQFRRNRGG
ncbi:MAG: hypothetical protein QGI83_21520 [Candidatus Latescibacteria bacterium]|jgi:uncharacterized protein HemX|nr:hypothetical protein [Candidatus Latescibacterota bacterium]